MSDKKSARLILEDGTTFTGYSFGAETATTGEVVFNTAMTGYPESLTDPSYSGQILVSTYPLVGNYGVPQKESEYGLLKFFESDRIHVKGLVISDYSFEYSHWNAGESLGEWLRENGVPGIWGIDTRQLTKVIRERGVMLGKIVVEGSAEPAAFDDPNLRNLAAEVSTPQVETYGDGPMKIVLVDCGCKYNIIRCLLSRGATVIRVPWDYDFTTLDYDGVMLSNGPGDPADNMEIITEVRKLYESELPLFAVCLGHQLLALATGAETRKMRFGHRGGNHPVKDLEHGRAYITSQNHGYVVTAESVDPAVAEVSHINVNEGSVEGLRYRRPNCFTVQFHPEAAPGPMDTEYLFDRFVDSMKGGRAHA